MNKNDRIQKNKGFFARNNNLLFEFFRTVLAIIISFGIAFAIIAVVSDKPFESIKCFILGPFASIYTMGEILRNSIPLVFTGIAASIMMHCSQFNMFGEGAFFIGGLAATIAAVYFHLPALFSTGIAILFSAVVTGAVGYIPAKLKSKLGVNEFVTSLMFNFIVLWVGLYLVDNVVKDPNVGDNSTRVIPEGARLANLISGTDVSTGLIVALVVIVAAYLFLFHTRWGYNLRMTGSNSQFADYSGINTKSAVVYSQVIGAGIAGMGGAVEILGNYTRFNWKALPGFGFDGFIIAIMSKNNPLLVPIAALFIGYIRTGANEMALMTDVASEVVAVIQAVVILLIAAQVFLSSLKQKSLNKNVGIGDKKDRNVNKSATD